MNPPSPLGMVSTSTLTLIISFNLFVLYGAVSSTASPVLSLALSSSDFPALIASPAEPSIAGDDASTVEDPAPSRDIKAQEKAERKVAKKAAAAEKAAERQKIAQERAAVKAVERAKIAQEKLVEKERVTALKAQELLAEKERIANEKKKGVKLENERLLQLQKDRAAQAEKEKVLQNKKPGNNKGADNMPTSAKSSTPSVIPPKSTSKAPEPEIQVPLLSKKPKKTRPTTKPIKVPKEGPIHDETSTLPSVLTSDSPRPLTDSSSNNSPSHSLDRTTPTSVEELLEDIDILHPGMDLPNHPFFDVRKINPAATMPLEYGPLVHALSALSVGGGSFANNMPSGSIDNAVSSFQQLLETLTQTISDLLRLLPRTTWDDSSSFDGVLRDMLKGDDFLDDGGDEGQGKEDEVAALTLALERRARWMEVQLSKLEELHRDINTAAVRAVLSFNDSGWDRYAFMPRVGNTLRRFDGIGMVEESGGIRPMTADELEKKLTVAKEAAVFAETEVREVMDRIQSIRPVDCD
jgi:CCR4-NOT transcription complex subunit 4